MSAKAYDKKTAAFAGFIIQNMPDGLTDEIMEDWMDNPVATKRLLSGFVPPKTPAELPKASEPEPAQPQIPLLSVVASTSLGAVVGKPTAQCFVGSRYAYRNDNFDRWLQTGQPMATACTITTLAPAREATFAEWAMTILGVSADTPVEMLDALLKEHDHTMTLAQVEDMVEAAERKAKNGMRTDGWGNFFFVENEDGSVSVGDVNRGRRGWNASVYGLDYGCRWYADNRLLVRNLDASKLGA